MALSQNWCEPGLRVLPSVKVAEVMGTKTWVQPAPGELCVHIVPHPALIGASLQTLGNCWEEGLLCHRPVRTVDKGRLVAK